MTIWLPELDGRTGPRYKRIAAAIGDAIEDGSLKPGDRLPPQREMAYQLRLTVSTISRAYALAEHRGLLAGEVGRGTFVRLPDQDGRDLIARQTDNATINLGINTVMGPRQAEALKHTLATLLNGNNLEELLSYLPSAGTAEHRAAAADWIGRRGVVVPPEQVVMTCGAQHGLSLAVGAVTAPGETILCERLTYPGLIDTARQLDRKLFGVELDEEGVIPEALEAAAKQQTARVAVLVPTAQNPTASMMSIRRREAIAEVARANDLTIIEDDVYGLFPDPCPTPLVDLIPERTIYLSCPSKSLAPGLRVGWMVPPENLVPMFISGVHATIIMQAALVQEVFRIWVNDGTADRLFAQLRADVAARYAVAARIFAGHPMRGDPACFHVFLSLPEPWRGSTFAEAARAEGIRITPASMFHVGTGDTPRAVRISVAAAPSLESLEQALSKLRSLIGTGRGFAHAVV